MLLVLGITALTLVLCGVVAFLFRDAQLAVGGAGAAGEPAGRSTGMSVAEGYRRFRWSVPCPEGGWFQVSVLTTDREPRVLTTSEALEQPLWEPAMPTAAGWGEEIRWVVEVFDAAGNAVERREARGRRRGSD